LNFRRGMKLLTVREIICGFQRIRPKRGSHEGSNIMNYTGRADSSTFRMDAVWPILWIDAGIGIQNTPSRSCPSVAGVESSKRWATGILAIEETD